LAENAQGGFNTEGPNLKLFVVSAADILVFYPGLDVIFGLTAPGERAVLPFILRYIRHTLVGACVSAGAPWVFVKLYPAEKVG
jgi:hypothetical protein